MTKAQAEVMARLTGAGFVWHDANQLRLISMTLRRWSERECGNENGCITRDETTNRPYWESSWNGRRYPIPDRETGALRRLRAIMSRYPGWLWYRQGDPRGAALWLMREADLPPGEDGLASYYTRGIAVY